MDELVSQYVQQLRLAQSTVHIAGRWCQRRGLYRSYYEALLARNGGLKTKAVCAIARKLVPLLLAVLQRGQPFDRERWEAARHQPVLAH